MGTNYYAECESKTSFHIGKSSAGWCFSLHVLPEEGLRSWGDWKRLLALPSTIIRDEYQEILSYEKFFEVVENRFWNRSIYENDFLSQNNASVGPRGLLRRNVDGVHCVGHGEGTWDYLPGDFS